MFEIQKQTTVYRVSTDAQAEELIKNIKAENATCNVDSKIDHKNKKSKGEIVDEWCLVTVTHLTLNQAFIFVGSNPTIAANKK